MHLCIVLGFYKICGRGLATQKSDLVREQILPNGAAKLYAWYLLYGRYFTLGTRHFHNEHTYGTYSVHT
jgi:hypothetical protein